MSSLSRRQLAGEFVYTTTASRHLSSLPERRYKKRSHYGIRGRNLSKARILSRLKKPGATISLAIASLVALQLVTSLWLINRDARSYQDIATAAQLNHITDDLLHVAQQLAFAPALEPKNSESSMAMLEHLASELARVDSQAPTPWTQRLAVLAPTVQQLRADAEAPAASASLDRPSANQFLQQIDKLLVALDGPDIETRAGAISIKRIAWKMNRAVAAEASLLTTLLGNKINNNTIMMPAQSQQLLVLRVRSNVHWESLARMTEDVSFPAMRAAIDQLRAEYSDRFSVISETFLLPPASDASGHTTTLEKFSNANIAPMNHALGAVFEAAFAMTEEKTAQLQTAAIKEFTTHSVVLAISIVFSTLLYMLVHRVALAPLQRLQTVLHTAVDGIITIDTRGTVQSFNNAAEQIFGYTAAEICGRNISILMPEPEASAHDEYLARYLRTGEAKVVGIGREVHGLRRDGTVFPMRLAVGKQNGTGTAFFTGIVRDITQEKIADQALHDRKALLNALHSGMSRFVEFSDQNLTYEYLLASLLAITRSDYGFVAEVFFDARNNPYLRTRAITDISWNEETRRQYDASRENGMEFRNLATLFGAALTTGKPVISNDPSHDPRRAGVPMQHPPLNAFLGVPIYHAGKLVGMYGIANRVGGYSAELVEFLQPFTSSCGILINAMRTANERLAYQHNLAQAKDAAEAANRAKSQFLSSMSHELRTPLNVMLGFAQLLKMDAKSPLNADQQSEVEQVLKAGWHLLELINGVLDLAKIESGRLDLVLEPIDVGLFVSECIDFVATLAVQRNITINNKTPATTKLAVNADPTRIRQVLLNLLTNAMKYNRPNGSVNVVTTSDEGRVRISVENTGLGLTAEQMQHLFEPFNRLGMEGGNIEGTGIGLVISKRLIELMGGVIGAQSVAGQGSTFWLELPAVALPTPREIETESAQIDSVSETETKTQPCTVLYIEDNASNTKLITQLLNRRRGLSLLTAATGTAGLASARSQIPDVILLDINLPDLDGFAVKEQLRAHDATKNIPVIAISADAMPANIERARQAGFVDYVTKPFDVSHLFKLLDAALRR